MVLKSAFAAAACAIFLATGGFARAEDYHPGEYLNLDLSHAVLSPKRLGPPAEFAPTPPAVRGGARLEGHGRRCAVRRRRSRSVIEAAAGFWDGARPSLIAAQTNWGRLGFDA